MAMVLDKWSALGSALGSILFLWSMLQNHIPAGFRDHLATWAGKLAAYVNPYHEITVSEHGAQRFNRSEFFLAVEAYLSDVCARRARRLKAELGADSKKLQVSVDNHEEVTDTFAGAVIWWYSSTSHPRSTVISFFPGEEERHSYRVVFHRRHRDLVVDSYMPYVLEEGRAVIVRNRQRRLFTNNPSSSWRPYRANTIWSHVKFEHPATFDTLAMDPAEKQAIVDDLTEFRDAKSYYSKVGKPWKRGYLLYGPPGTGKSTMIAAMANFLDYDVYDLELTAVKNNTELRKLFIETTGKSIIVIEDIDCSVDLTGKRKDKKKKPDDGEDGDRPKLAAEAEKDNSTNVTLSGLLNFIDGLWSACGGERIIIFTTNYKDKLDPALIRRGRMDKHIQMSFCRFGAFKVLAKNYLDVEEHELFGEIGQLLDEIDMSPADVAENLMPMSKKKREAATCLAGLVEALKKAKEDAAAAKALADMKAKEKAEAEEKSEAEGKKAGGEDEGKAETSDSEQEASKTSKK